MGLVYGEPKVSSIRACIGKRIPRQRSEKRVVVTFLGEGRQCLYIYYQPVVSKVNAFGKPLFCLGMKSDVVREVCEKGAPHTQFARKSNGISDQLVGVVRSFPAQGVDHKRVDALQVGQLRVGNRLHVGDIGHRSDAESENRHLVVHDLYGNNLQIADVQRLMRRDGVEREMWHAGVEMTPKTVEHVVLEALAGIGIGKYIDRSEGAERAHIINPGHMVVMNVGDENAVYFTEREGENLLSEIGTAVNQNACVFRFNQSGCAKPLVAWVAAVANRAVAADNGYSV